MTLSELYTAAMAPRKYECADRDETLRMIGEQDEAARRAKVDEAVAQILKANELFLSEFAKEKATAESNRLRSVQIRLEDIMAIHDALAALKESLEEL